MPFKLVGLTQLGQASFGGASIAQVTLPVAQRLTHKPRQLDQISVAAEPGVSQVQLKRRIEKVLPLSARVETATENADRSSEEIRETLGFLQTILLVFGYVAVLVGAFIIFNTFSITVAQRVSEFGVLRTLGASRRQILGSVLFEALGVGLIGAVLGIAGGFLIAAGLHAAFAALGADLPTTSPVLETRTVIVSALVAFVVTFLSALVPAWRSTRVPPIAALHAFSPAPSRRRRIALLAVAALLAAIGIATVVAGLAGGGSIGTRAAKIGGGGVAVVVAVSLFSPLLVRPLADLAGWPLEWLRRLTGRLARENAKRNPGRTAVTAAALMISLALVTFITVFAAGLKSSVAQVIEENFAGGLVIENSDGFSPIPAGAALAASKVPGVKSVATLRSAEARVGEAGGATVKVDGPTPNIEEGVNIEWLIGGPRDAAPPGRRRSGRLRRIRQGTRPRDRRHLHPAEPVGGAAEADRRGRVRIEGEDLRRRPRHPEGDARRLPAEAGHDRLRDRRTGRRRRKSPGPAHRRRRTRLPDRRSPEPGRTARRTRKADRLDRLALLRPARTGGADLADRRDQHALALDPRAPRELGMLRAIGMSRRQVRTMIRYEAVITALIGAILGLVLGIVFAALIAQPLKQEGFTLSYPIGTLIGILVAAALIGVIAAIIPARLASRLNVLESLQYE